MRMDRFTAFVAGSGRIAPRPFALKAAIVYVVSFLSQFLLAAPVMAHASVVPFLLVQIAVAWSWYALHVRRLRDAGRPVGPALAFTLLYLLAIVLLLLATLATNDSASGGEGAPFAAVAQIFLLLFLIGTVLGDPTLGMFGYVMLAVLVLVMLPIVMALAFTVWAGTRPTATTPP
jgi:uncharacterized membrane protein YhaH (DUF805 family)